MFALIVYGALMSYTVVHAQEAITSTPAPVDLSGAAAQQPLQSNPPTLTRTPTDAPPARLEPLESANVRAEPSTDASILGVIRAGEVYNVTGRYFQWYQFQYQQSPNGRGWVFAELVRIDGDPNAVPEIDLSAQPTVDTAQLGLTETMAVITQTPGGLLTATANARIIAPPPGAGGSVSGEGSVSAGTFMPTFTYPAGAVFVPTQDTAAALAPDTPAPSPISDEGGGLPPIVPILVMGGIGVLGLAISSVRR
ncbi:MAG: SH3 domain-containing protein [Chloroflexota bacterium]|nr:SH3 domain-containing protein [Chloroflexota bacterium]